MGRHGWTGITKLQTFKKTPKVIFPVFSPEKLLGTFSIYHVDDFGFSFFYFCDSFKRKNILVISISSTQQFRESLMWIKCSLGIYVYVWNELFDEHARLILSQGHELVQTNTFRNECTDNIPVTKMTILHQSIYNIDHKTQFCLLVSLIERFSAKLW